MMATPDTIALREQLLECLRSAGEPLSTSELAALMPWRVERTHDNCALLCDRKRLSRSVKVLECHLDWHLVQYRRTAQGYAGVYPHLCQLERLGKITRTCRSGRKGVFWTLTEAADTATDRHARALRCSSPSPN
ncbi:hypothetical protein [[Mycobacterium] nativiensis]|uniref:Transcriptional regulator n=1 Tax=[Mycobacterium] nativiensis TaxID=2855503 RepID=A0ABU5XVH0_9MYCO|nr:hypothetical protein [Mycolicibacter sp. MYC340]MEB3031778.1 hypothetical protein [Mycolicibacter sp. MYC340]